MTLQMLGATEPVPPMVSLFTPGWGAWGENWSASPPSTSAAWETSNRGIWLPVNVPTVCVAKRVWWANGGTVSGTTEAGIYLDAGYKPGAKLVTSGSVSQTGTSQIQFADITDTTLTPQLYWLYMSASTTAALYLRSSVSTGFFELAGFQQASIGPGSAPSTATPAERASGNTVMFGFSTTTIT